MTVPPSTIRPPMPGSVPKPAIPVIEANHLTKRYGSKLAVHDLSFQVYGGKVTGFLGPNGAGKTTALKVILGLLSPSSGTATVYGQEYKQLDTPLAVVGAVIENPPFHPARKARDSLKISAACMGFSYTRIDEVLNLVGLYDVAKSRVKTFSFGMRQRLSLAAALMGNPPILILDEPANGLDPQGIHWLRQFLRSYVSGGNTVFISSHVLAEIAQLVDDVVVISQGCLVAQAPVGELLSRTTTSLRVTSPQIDKLVKVLEPFGVNIEVLAQQTVLVTGKDEGINALKVGQLAADNGIVLSELVEQRSSLEDVFLDLTSSLPTKRFSQ